MAKRKSVPSNRSKTNKSASKKRAGNAPDNGEVDVKTPKTPANSHRLLPIGDELKSLYQRYTGGATFDDHDKAFYFVLDVGGLSRAKQLLAHVQEVLAELEEVEQVDG